MPIPAPYSEPSPSYKVVARRYRPQGFGELIGQEHVAQALSNAIATHRVGHAYLFTGARGTGKTSTARIFAKALNCVNGPTAEPCNKCDACQSISTRATTWTYWKSTGPATATSTTSASCGRTSTFGPVDPGSRSTLSTKSTC